MKQAEKQLEKVADIVRKLENDQGILAWMRELPDLIDKYPAVKILMDEYITGTAGKYDNIETRYNLHYIYRRYTHAVNWQGRHDEYQAINRRLARDMQNWNKKRLL